MIKWSKRNVLIEKGDEGFTHASHPCVIHIDKDNYLLIFSSRKNSKSHIFMTYAELKYGSIKILQKPKLILSPSKPGYFDGEGLLSCCLVKDDEKIYLYYSGWQNIDKNFWHCDTGRAIIDLKKEIAFREFDGPVMGRDKDNPIFAAITSVHVENNEWKAWYNSGISWTKKDGVWHPTYGIHYATSKNGVDWDSRKGLIIKLKDEYEHSFGRPSVVRWDNKYKMWFSHRGTKNYSTYRIGYAESKDGINWERNDDQSGIDISETGWDSESVCYPYLVEHENLRYMLYNGNNYGMTGLGYAVGDKKK